VALNAGDAYLDIHSRLAANFGRQLANQVQAPVTKAGQEASHHFARSFGHGIATVGKGIGIGIAAGLGLAVAAAVKLVPVLKQSVQGYRDHLKVVAQTTAAIKSTGGAANVSVKQVGKLSDALERKTTVDGDVIQTGQNMLLTFKGVANQAGKNNDIFNQASATVLDMAAAFGHGTVTSDGMQNASIQLGKALNDPIKGIGALSRVGVTFTEQQKKQIKTMVESGNTLGAQKIILKELNSEFGGSAAAQATASGRMQVAWHQLQDTIGSVLLPVVDRFENSLGKKLIPDINVLAQRWGPAVQRTLLSWVDSFTRLLPSTKELGYGITALGAAFHGEGITTQAGTFVGTMERLGIRGRQVLDWARNFGPLLGRIGRSFTKLFTASSQAGPALQQAGGGGHIFANSLMVIGPVLDVVARNLHNILPWLPAILAGFLAFGAIKRVTQPLVQVGELISNVTAPFRIAALFAQNRALRSHTAALTQNTLAIGGNTAATEVATGASNVGVLAMVRARVATIANAVAQKVAAAASKAWAAAQWLVNAALTANPIGIVIVAIAALTAGIIYAYKHSETFRRIIDTVWRGIRAATATAVAFILRLLQGWLNTWLTIAGGIVHGAAIAFGWIPGIGGKLKAADRAFGRFKDAVNEKINGIIKNVDVTVRGHDKVKPVINQIAAEMKTRGYSVTARLIRGGTAQKGTRVPGYGGGDRHPYLLEGGETVVPKELTPEIAPWAAMRGIPGFRRGGLVRWPGNAYLTATKDALLSRLPGPAGFTGGAASGNVIRLALAQARRMAASFKVALALIEAGIVESGLRNLNYGDRDSLGFLQQRPSQGWLHPMNISYAAWDFLRRAIPIQGRYGTAGMLAQAVQRSAFPGRYDQQQARALGILHAYGYDRGGLLPPGLSLAYNGTGRPEPVGAGGVTIERGAIAIYAAPGMNERQVAAMTARAVARALDDRDRRAAKGPRV
jgi:hypothetical protein